MPFEYQAMNKPKQGRVVAGEEIEGLAPTSPRGPRAPRASAHRTSTAPLSSADLYRAGGRDYDHDHDHGYRERDHLGYPIPQYAHRQSTLPAADSRHSIAMSSIHAPDRPDRKFLGGGANAGGRRGSDATWGTGEETSDSETRAGADSPWQKDEGFNYSRGGSSTLLNKYQDDDQGHTYPAPAPLEKGDRAGLARAAANKRRRRRRWIFIAIALLVVLVALGVGIGLAKYFTSRHKSSGSTGTSSMPNTGQEGTPTTTETGNQAVLWGNGGDHITTSNGTVFQYNNTIGGTWVGVPFNDTARPAADQPALNEKWDYSHNRILGVNLGGWLVLEPFIAPYMFEPYVNNSGVVDEWTLSIALGNKLSSTLTAHYDTFITEIDFANIAAAGLNWVRLPVGWWMIETWGDEPFLEGVAFKYFLNAIQWARKYGLRINLDLHAVPGSQNGYNHSGKQGTINFLMGVMGVANAQRTLNYIRILTEFISQPQYSNVVPMFSVLNEALMQQIGSQPLREYYYQTYQMMRAITGIGEGKGPFMVIHDGFGGPGGGHLAWGGYLAGADRLGLDTHPYLCFVKQNNDSMGYNSAKPCAQWASTYNTTMANFGFSMAGEYSLAINDCGLYLNNIGAGTRYEGTFPNATTPDTVNFPRVGSCDPWNDYTTWSDATRKGFRDLARTSQDALQNSFFWTWKIGYSINSDLVPNPMWSYELGLKEGWINLDARGSVGSCGVVAPAQGVSYSQVSWPGTLSAWATGGAGAGTIAASQVANYSVWPPTGISAGSGSPTTYPYTNLPQYTPTGTIKTLTPTSPSSALFPAGASSTAAGNGWFNSADTTGWWVSASGCSYPDPWSGQNLAYPSAPCGGGAQKRDLPAPTTPPVAYGRQ